MILVAYNIKIGHHCLTLNIVDQFDEEKNQGIPNRIQQIIGRLAAIRDSHLLLQNCCSLFSLCLCLEPREIKYIGHTVAWFLGWSWPAVVHVSCHYLIEVAGSRSTVLLSGIFMALVSFFFSFVCYNNKHGELRTLLKSNRETWTRLKSSKMRHTNKLDLNYVSPSQSSIWAHHCFRDLCSFLGTKKVRSLKHFWERLQSSGNRRTNRIKFYDFKFRRQSLDNAHARVNCFLG